MIVIVDYGMGNLRSIKHKFDRMGIPSAISSDVEEIARADKLILPGVGNFAAAMQNLEKLRLIPILEKKVIDEKTPILGICLGMQLLTGSSEEGHASGLGWIDAETVRFNFGDANAGLKIPHMGWNSVSILRDSQILDGIDNNLRFYFVHSYHVACKDQCNAVAKTCYGYDFPPIIQKGHIYGIQFHPEKSHGQGIKILKNFASVS